MLQLTVILRHEIGTYNEATEMVEVDGLACPKDHLHCQDRIKGTYVWEDKEATCSRTHKEVYLGQGSLHSTRLNESSIVMISDNTTKTYAGKKYS